MNLEEVNKSYLDTKAKLAQVSAEIEVLDKKLKIADLNKRKHEVARDEAELKGNETKKVAEQARVDKILKEIEKINEDLKSKKVQVKAFQILIDRSIEEIKQDPAMKQVMNEALAKRYDRQLNKYTKEKEKALLEKDAKVSEKNRFEALKKLITEHPALEKNLKGIINAKQTIKKLNDELATLDYQKDAHRIAEISGKEMKEATDKLDNNKTPLMNYITNNDINVKFEDIEKLAETGLSIDQTIDGLGKEIKGYDKRIKGYDKSINNYSVALDNVRGEMGRTSPAPTAPAPTTPAPVNKPKWYQFGKRFKNWIDQRRQAGAPTPAPTPAPTSNNNIRDALKYEVVRELYGFDEKIKDSNDKVIGINHHFGTMEQAQLHEATGRKGKDEGPEL